MIEVPYNKLFCALMIMSVIISHTLDTIFIWLCLAFHYLCTFYPEMKNFSFTFCPPECTIISCSFKQPFTPRTLYKAFPVSSKALFISEALQLLQIQLYQDEKHLLCLHSFSEQLMPAHQFVQWEVEKRGRKRMWAGSEMKSPFYCLSRGEKEL